METKKIHVGNLVRETVKQSDYSFSQLAQKIDISRQKLNGWMKKDDLLVKDLFTISEALGIDIVKKFCLPKGDEQDTKVILHIEIEKDKANEVLRMIKDKQLYNILKR